MEFPKSWRVATCMADGRAWGALGKIKESTDKEVTELLLEELGYILRNVDYKVELLKVQQRAWNHVAGMDFTNVTKVPSCLKCPNFQWVKSDEPIWKPIERREEDPVLHCKVRGWLDSVETSRYNSECQHVRPKGNTILPRGRKDVVPYDWGRGQTDTFEDCRSEVTRKFKQPRWKLNELVREELRINPFNVIYSDDPEELNLQSIRWRLLYEIDCNLYKGCSGNCAKDPDACAHYSTCSNKRVWASAYRKLSKGEFTARLKQDVKGRDRSC